LNQQKTHIAILCSDLNHPGGIERAIVNTANLLSENNYKVTLLISDESLVSFYPLNASILVLGKQMNFGISAEGNIITRKINFFKDLFSLRKLINKINPDFLLSTEYHLNAAACIAMINLNTKIIGWEHHHYNELKPNRFWRKLIQYTYPRLHSIVCLNKDEEKYYQKLNKNLYVIPNFIIKVDKPQCTKKEKILLTIGRLETVKGIDHLLKVAEQVLKKHPTWKWKLIGAGSLYQITQQFINESFLANRLILKEPVSYDLEGEYAKAAIYVMTSRNECFPMTLLEAMTRGIPCISFDCETGPRNIIMKDIDGVLISDGNIKEMSNRINNLIENEDTRKKMGERAYENIQRFSPKIIFKQWKQLFDCSI
jgi:glycosyltransferase involved in cell wall biosynthesis